MSTIFDLDITGIVSKRGGNILDKAHEYFVIAILMKLGFDVAISRSSSSPYDLLITAYEKGMNSTRQFLKTKIKTCAKRINFDANNSQNDLIIRVVKNTLDLYLVPSMFLRDLRRSKSLNKLDCFKNNWNVLLNWRKVYLNRLLQEIVW